MTGSLQRTEKWARQEITSKSTSLVREGKIIKEKEKGRKKKEKQSVLIRSFFGNAEAKNTGKKRRKSG